MALKSAETVSELLKVVHQTHHTLYFTSEDELRKLMDLSRFIEHPTIQGELFFEKVENDSCISLAFCINFTTKFYYLISKSFSKIKKNYANKPYHISHRVKKPANLAYNVSGKLFKYSKQDIQSLSVCDTYSNIRINENRILYEFNNKKITQSGPVISLVQSTYYIKDKEWRESVFEITSQTGSNKITQTDLFNYLPHLKCHKFKDIKNITKLISEDEINILSMLIL